MGNKTGWEDRYLSKPFQTINGWHIQFIRRKKDSKVVAAYANSAYVERKNFTHEEECLAKDLEEHNEHFTHHYDKEVK